MFECFSFLWLGTAIFIVAVSRMDHIKLCLFPPTFASSSSLKERLSYLSCKLATSSGFYF
uniref:Uncharacterized protein n=1 Tax=Rhizophora mucronata TaxID=61149 RepID=A0A2P2J3E7_RHIMU